MNKQQEKSNKPLNGKVAIVTGATAGIGFAIAKRLGLDGAKVVLCSRKQANVDKAVQDLRSEGIDVQGVVCHVAISKDRKNLLDFALQKYGRIDILVNNAGINPHFGSILDVTEEVWDKLFNTNVKAGFLLSQQAVPFMEKQGGGNIIFVSSVAGYVPPQGIAAYGVTKTALFGLVKALSITCGASNIRVNSIAPGLIKTDFSRTLWENEELLTINQHHIPLNRIGTPDECSGIVSFLCSDQASYITGENIVVNGGMTSRL